ncbi:MAG UNVERIFIED_CONTAM: hypothetical protein LVR18_40310 [Planctomycetaceae bacterium]|jgi:hypothetical protein
MFRHVTSKQGKSINEVYRWEGLQDDGQATWLHIASLTNGFEPVGALPDGQLILRKARTSKDPVRNHCGALTYFSTILQNSITICSQVIWTI